MTEKWMNLHLPEGIFSAKVTYMQESDDILLRKIYNSWRSLSNDLMSIGGRAVNIPEGLSENVFCRAMDVVRVNSSISGANSSFDVYNPRTHKRIQVKACSVLPDLTSFGPRSVWDELYFMDFYVKGKWDGTIHIYKIPTELIYSHRVNENETMRDQQKQNRRPRFSIFRDIIQAQGIKPEVIYKI